MLASASNVYAYLDPGTGSLFIQGIIATVAMAGVTIRLYWQRLLAVFRRADESLELGTDEVNDAARSNPES